MIVVRQVGLDDIDKGQARAVAELVQLFPRRFIIGARPAAGQVFIEPVGVDVLSGAVRKMKRCVGVLIQQRRRKAAVNDDIHNRGKDKHQKYHDGKASEYDAVLYFILIFLLFFHIGAKISIFQRFAEYTHVIFCNFAVD